MSVRNQDCAASLVNIVTVRLRLYIHILIYNAYGFKSSYHLVDNELLIQSDIVFMCEHWFKPNELGQVRKTYIKSSIDAETVLEGRPHEGVGLICNKVDHVTYKGIDTDNERISGIQLIANGKVHMNILGVYLP